nr:hypothetical protein Ade03nite_42450 [Actinoplanes derwentensis]
MTAGGNGPGSTRSAFGYPEPPVSVLAVRPGTAGRRSRPAPSGPQPSDAQPLANGRPKRSPSASERPTLSYLAGDRPTRSHLARDRSDRGCPALASLSFASPSGPYGSLGARVTVRGFPRAVDRLTMASPGLLAAASSAIRPQSALLNISQSILASGFHRFTPIVTGSGVARTRHVRLTRP